ALGVEPGANGSYFQSVPFRKTMPNAESTITLTRAGAAPVVLRFGEEFITYGDPTTAEKIAEGDVVYAGFGITAPDQKYDDYANLDVRGKVVAVFNGAPKRFPTELRAHYSSGLNKSQTAAAHGAIGLITVVAPKEDRAPWPRVVRQVKLGSMHWLEANGAPHAVDPRLSSSASFSKSGLEALFTGSPAPLADVTDAIEKGEPHPFALPVHARMRFISAHQDVKSPNVVGVVRGSDPKLRDEFIVYSAHLDHLGISEPVNGDAINNGALDNASGIAAMLEVAEAFATAKSKPKRSIIFLATTGEEKGLRGADYFASNPTVPLDNLVANINIDEIMMLHETRDYVALGAETNDIGDAAARVAKTMNMEISPDPFPQEVFFVRSDQYPFVKQGVPAIYVYIGYKALDPKVDAMKEQEEWMHTRYHSPSDDMTQVFDYAIAAKLADFNYRLGLDVANAPNRPRWKPGNFFGETFGRRK
ncbi:MAG TPA: M28 family metallopeptidase, partial [Thermoanaerobaculia bacterium]|nr:M28 family metallopeptidase [Thermoanaerobaculia bacterium]